MELSDYNCLNTFISSLDWVKLSPSVTILQGDTGDIVMGPLLSLEYWLETSVTILQCDTGDVVMGSLSLSVEYWLESSLRNKKESLSKSNRGVGAWLSSD